MIIDILTVAKMVTPIISALTAAEVIILGVINEKGTQKRLKGYVLLYLLSTAIGWAGLLAYFYMPLVFAYLNSFFFLSFLLMPLFLYTFIFQITRTRPEEHLSRMHWALPVLLPVFVLVLTLVTPMEDQLKTIQGKGVYQGGSYLFFWVSNNKFLFRLAFCLFYILLSLYRLPRYRAFIFNYSANEARSSLRWLKVCLILMLCLIPFPLVGFFLAHQALLYSPYIILHILLLIFQLSYVTYHVVNNDFVMNAPDTLPQNSVMCSDFTDKEHVVESVKSEMLNKANFERYIQKNKPYLNPEIKITDLVLALSTNRSYLSSFINTEYGMNFSTYINSLRIREFANLKSLPENEGVTIQELAEKAGFGSYRSYHRCMGNSAQRMEKHV
jgi:AraC-like DNA-binding protein